VAEHRHALLIASSAYDDPKLQRLAAPHNDAKLLASVLKSPVGGFSVRTLSNPTSARAGRAVEEFFTHRNYDDVLLFYFSGHGLKTDDGELFFATRNTRQKLLRSSSLPAGLLRDVMRYSGCDRQILILDCCYGGAFARGFKSDDTVDASERFQGYGTVVLTASNALEFAWEDPDDEDADRSSVYTSVLVEGLRDLAADLDGDGRVTVEELHKFARKRIQQLHVAQTPTMSSVGQEGELVVGRGAPRPRTTSASANIDLAPYFIIKDSGPEGSVVGQSIAGAMEASLAYHGREERLSARYVYAKAKLLDNGEEAFRDDTGAYIETGLRVATNWGVPRAETWPYVPQQHDFPDGESWDSVDAARPRFKALVHPITSYEQIPYYLLRGQAIVTGFMVYRDMWDSPQAARDGWLQYEGESALMGGHAVAIVGYVPSRDALKFANSWGTDWGDAGFGYIDRLAVEKSLHVSEESEDDAGPAPRFWAIEVPLTPEFCLDEG
jgi:hypothetical protein